MRNKRSGSAIYGETGRGYHRGSKLARDLRRDEAIVRLLLDTGVSCPELCLATIGDLDLENSFLPIVPGKGEELKGSRSSSGRE